MPRDQDFKGKNTAEIDYQGYFNNINELKAKIPRGQPGFFARVGKDFYNWNSLIYQWILVGGGQQSQQRFYPKDYIAPLETIKVEQYENYAVWNPLVIDGILEIDGTVIIN